MIHLIWNISRSSIKRGRSMALKPNDKAPDFGLFDQDGKKVSLSDFRGSKVLLFFYPKAGTSG
jgi:peroxiredoxin Q/BCP